MMKIIPIKVLKQNVPQNRRRNHYHHHSTLQSLQPMPRCIAVALRPNQIMQSMKNQNAYFCLVFIVSIILP